MPLVFLGTSQAIPTAKRNHTAVLLSYKEETLLIDCGEGTQRQFRKARLNPCKITKLLITHWHGDHVLGLPGLFQTLALSNYNRKLDIYGPAKTKIFTKMLIYPFIPVLKFEANVNEVQGKFLETNDFYIEAFPLQHGVPCNAYSFVEKDKIRIDKKKLEKLKIPGSPLIGELQKGKDIKFNGKTIKSEDVTYKEKGKKITIILDTELTENCYKAAENADLLIAEATYSNDDKELAKEYKHLTAGQAAQIAKKARCKKLILTHISQRYQSNEKILLEEARKIFRNTELAEDLMKVEV
ncbi:ribonuclease Z [Candidatus Pacearchaeota archaeon RBG_13_36_9]|nr:MAG: ribonuclease Z [Candidatus Pacearchaeota archaeon RBG_13_36_9]